jgi:hypothetical protein
MGKPKADPPLCDNPGCGMPADESTDESWPADGLHRNVVPNLNVCQLHHGWAYSEDALLFTTDPKTESRYRSRT